MAGYTRQATNNIVNNSVIDADDLNAEYNALAAGFNASTGHTHDGTSGEGGAIENVGPAQDLVITSALLQPKSTNTLDIGSNLLRFKDSYFTGAVNSATVAATGNATVGGTLDVTGVLTSTGGVTGNVTGDVTGGVTGNVTGNLTGNVTGDVTGNVTGNLTGNVTGTVSDVSNHDTGAISEGSNLYYTDARSTAAAKAAISVTDSGGDGSLTYSAGAITYTGPSATETRGHFSSGTGVTITDGSVAIGQSVGTSDNVTFNNATISGDLTVSGTTTTVNSNDVNIADATLTLNSDETGTPSQDAGIVIERGTADNKSFIWDESEDKWTVGSETLVAGTFEGALTGDVTGNVTGTAATVTASAQPNITSLGTLTTLTVDDITINGSTISDGATLTIDAGSSINLDSGDGLIQFLEDSAVRGGIYFDQSSWIDFRYGASAEIRMSAGGVRVAHGLYVGSTGVEPTDNDIYAEADITANRDLYVGDDIIMTAGASDWKFEVDGSNQLIISYGGVNKMKLDASGNLTVTGDVTGYGTI